MTKLNNFWNVLVRNRMWCQMHKHWFVANSPNGCVECHDMFMEKYFETFGGRDDKA